MINRYEEIELILGVGIELILGVLKFQGLCNRNRQYKYISLPFPYWSVLS